MGKTGTTNFAIWGILIALVAAPAVGDPERVPNTTLTLPTVYSTTSTNFTLVDRLGVTIDKPVAMAVPQRHGEPDQRAQRLRLF